MLHKMSEVRGWTHNEMMSMNKRIFYRYYGYWYSDRLKEEAAQKEAESKQQNNNQERNWKSL